MKPLMRYNRPVGLEMFVLKNADYNYCIFDEHDRHICSRTCEECRNWAIRDYEKKLKHGQHIDCIVYGGCTALNKKFGRKKRTEYGRVIWFRKNGKTTFAQVDDYEIDYDRPKPEVSFYAWEQFKINRDEQIHIRKTAEWWREQTWKQMKSMKLTTFYSGQTNKGDKVLLYESELGTDLQHADVRTVYPEYALSYLAEFLRHPGIEILQKSGFFNIVEEKIAGKGCKYINWNGTDLKSVLRSSKGEIKHMRDKCYSIYDIERWKMLKNSIPDVSIQEFEKLSTSYYIESSLRTLEQAELNNRNTITFCIRNNIRLNDYADYIEDCIKLERDVGERRIARPRDFQNVHQRLADLVKVHLTEIQKKQFTVNEKKISAMEEPYISGDYMIRPAEDSMELNKESEALNHCVRKYTPRVVNGSCAILFIRELQNPDKPFYTLELNPMRKIVQVRGKNNCSTTPEVDAFLKDWRKEYGIQANS